MHRKRIVNPPPKERSFINMNMINIDPGTKQEEATQAGEQAQQAAEETTQESAEEGTTEG